MTHSSWTCLLVENGPGLIDDNIRNVLQRAACELFLNKQEKRWIVDDAVSGIVTTAWTTHLVGTRSGVLFRAELDSPETQNYKVNFLLSEEELKRGADLMRELEEKPLEWVPESEKVPVEELYRFPDLGTGRKSLN